MMLIEAVYIGNSREAYIEKSFLPGMNIVFSDDNHVGKSVVMQGIMFALGSDPLFSSTLNYKDYYFAVDFQVSGESYSVLRQCDSFALKHGEELVPFDTAAEFRRYWNSSIFPLPSIVHKGEDHIVRLSLYNQMFFVSQSERSSAQIVNPGLYNKQDFVEMLYSIGNLAGRNLPEDEEKALKAERSELKALKKRLFRQAKNYNISDPALSVISSVADEVFRQEAVQAFEKLTDEIIELRKARNRLYNRMKKNEATLKELRSLNLNIPTGRLICLDCGSQQIGLELADSKMAFEITTSELRGQILVSLQDRINSYMEEIDLLDTKIRAKQTLLASMVEERDITAEDVIVYKEDCKDIAELDAQLAQTSARLNEIESILKSNNSQDRDIQEKRASFMGDILFKMNKAHECLCLGEKSEDYEKLFTTATESFTGSELTEYVLSRTYALADYLNHGCPIIVDSFRAEDLSTAREEKALRLFNGLNNQVIFTTTIKNEEHDKYESFDFVNTIDYSGYETNKILNTSHLDEFLEYLGNFGVSIRS